MSMGKNNEEAADLLGILGHATRYAILDELTRTPQLTVSDVVKLVNESQPLVSYHLLLLKSAGLIDAKKEGRAIFYAIRDQRTMSLIKKIFALAKGG
jgi:DNA-binding transcriptional ArsR family regulator